jgi:hypothetical protein
LQSIPPQAIDHITRFLLCYLAKILVKSEPAQRPLMWHLRVAGLGFRDSSKSKKHTSVEPIRNHHNNLSENSDRFKAIVQ